MSCCLEANGSSPSLQAIACVWHPHRVGCGSSGTLEVLCVQMPTLHRKITQVSSKKTIGGAEQQDGCKRCSSFCSEASPNSNLQRFGWPIGLKSCSCAAKLQGRRGHRHLPAGAWDRMREWAGGAEANSSQQC